MKKILVIFLCLVLALLSGCSSTNNTSDITDSNTQVSAPIIQENKPTLPESSESPSAPEQALPITPPQSTTPSTPPTQELPETDSDFDQTDEEERKKYYIRSNSNGLRVRSKNSTSSNVLGTLDNGDMLSYHGKSGEFYKTIFREQTAFVHSSYCSLVEFNQGDDKVESAIDLGASLLGHPYVWGSQRYHWGNGVLNTNFKAGEFDCSALVQYVFYISNNVILDVTSRAQSLNGTAVDKGDLRRGDLMFFTNASRYNKTGLERIGHVGIYFGGNYILHTASDHAVIEPISDTRWSYYLSARRVV